MQFRHSVNYDEMMMKLPILPSAEKLELVLSTAPIIIINIFKLQKFYDSLSLLPQK